MGFPIGGKNSQQSLPGGLNTWSKSCTRIGERHGHDERAVRSSPFFSLARKDKYRQLAWSQFVLHSKEKGSLLDVSMINTECESVPFKSALFTESGSCSIHTYQKYQKW